MTEIKIIEDSSGANIGRNEKTVSTNGYLILYLEGEKVRFVGNMDIRALTPILTKIALEKLVKS